MEALAGIVTGHVCTSVADDRLRNVGELQRDFLCGRFRDALQCARA
jgi:hypothetical protein